MEHSEHTREKKRTVRENEVNLFVCITRGKMRTPTETRQDPIKSQQQLSLLYRL